jgi:CheY-like chemotaxis protein
MTLQPFRMVRVLVADENPDDLEFVRRIHGRSPHETTAMADPAAFVAALLTMPVLAVTACPDRIPRNEPGRAT